MTETWAQMFRSQSMHWPAVCAGPRHCEHCEESRENITGGLGMLIDYVIDYVCM